MEGQETKIEDGRVKLRHAADVKAKGKAANR
jgi:hypothetical protein